jgi:cellulose synthase/poly-beta-1,6-N-acetylglucosamine synthase-like glycosyltransferase
MKTVLFLLTAAVALAWLLARTRTKPVRRYGCVDAIIPAYNEELCIVGSVENLLANPYIGRLIVVNDGSTDKTAQILDLLAVIHPRLVVIHQANTGKGGALMAGVARSDAKYVFLTDADTLLPADGDGLGYMIAEMERGAHAVGGIPSSNLTGAGLLPHIRATVKMPMIVIKRTFQQILGGSPFIISGACGLFRTSVLRVVPFSDRTKVEDLDLTWSLVAQGFKVRQTSRCVVYSQECNSLTSEWLRWRRWIVGYAVCMRLHSRLLFTRFGLFSILPMFLVVALGVGGYGMAIATVSAAGHVHAIPGMFFPVTWIAIVGLIGLVSAIHHRRWQLVPLAPAAVVYLILSYAIWIVHGVRGLVTGREPQRDKPVRYRHVVA